VITGYFLSKMISQYSFKTGDENGLYHGRVQYWEHQKGESVSFDGVYNHGKLQSGETLQYTNKYDGPVNKKGQCHGEGELGIKGVLEYKGGFKNGQLHGQGDLENEAQGFKYVGGFINGKKHGEGEMEDKRDKYTGLWKNDLKHGRGKMIRKAVGGGRLEYSGIWEDGECKHGVCKTLDRPPYKTVVYEGEFKNLKFHGQGKHVDNFTTFEGAFENHQFKWGRITPNPGKVVGWDYVEGEFNFPYVVGEMKKFNVLLKGKFKNFRLQGPGEARVLGQTPEDCLSHYKGGFLNGRKNGHGHIKLKSGEEYVGEWQNGLKHGEGFETLQDGETYTGMFQDGRRHGRGTVVDAEGNSHTCEWINGAKHHKKRPRPENKECDVICSICCHNPKNVVFDLCRHTFCGECADQFKQIKCPICNTVNNSVDCFYL
jgi:hypothetical protein